jgi:hypothetical protein
VNPATYRSNQFLNISFFIFVSMIHRIDKNMLICKCQTFYLTFLWHMIQEINDSGEMP